MDNPTRYLINVDVTGAERDGWLGVGAFGRERTRTVEELADQGLQWVFSFSCGGAKGGAVAVSRDELVRDGWRMGVPGDVAQRLRGAGLTESAP